jgi:hypothetical protein
MQPEVFIIMFTAALFLIFSTHISVHFPRGFIPSGIATNNFYAFLFSSIRATLRDLVILIISARECKLWSS